MCIFGGITLWLKFFVRVYNKKVCPNCNKFYIICSIETVRKIDKVNISLTSLNRSNDYIIEHIMRDSLTFIDTRTQTFG